MNREITKDPPYVFEEQQPMDEGGDKPQTFVPVVIRRDPSLTNERLAPEHSRIVGAAVLDRLEEIFGKTDSALPKIARGSRPDPGKWRRTKQLDISSTRDLISNFERPSNTRGSLEAARQLVSNQRLCHGSCCGKIWHRGVAQVFNFVEFSGQPLGREDLTG